MSGSGPPHHPHNRHVPPANTAWNHLAVPGFFPRQPQVAHMQAEHSLIHQPTWHTPTTSDAMKLMPHAQMLEMFKNEALFPRADCVDLSLTRNGNQNGELPSSGPAAISLSVRDASKINSLPPGMLDIQAMELTKCVSPNLKSAVSPGSIRSTSMSPGLKSSSPGLLGSGTAMKSLSPGRKSLSPGPKSSSPGLNLSSTIVLPPTLSATIVAPELGKNPKRSNIRVDSILERLNPILEKTFPYQEIKQHDQPVASSTSIPVYADKSQAEKSAPVPSQSVIVSAASNFDENSNSSGTTNVPTPKEEDSASMHSNEDSLDSTKSRRKRKPSKTVRVNKEDEVKIEKDRVSPESISQELPPIQTNHKEESSDPAIIATILEGGATKVPEQLSESPSDELDDIVPTKTRRKTSSESETIDNIAAMVQEGLKEKGKKAATDGIMDVEDRVKLLEVEPHDEPMEVEEESEQSIFKEDTSKVESELAVLDEGEVISAEKDTTSAPDEKSESAVQVDGSTAVEGPNKMTDDDDEIKENEEIVESVLVDTVDGPECNPGPLEELEPSPSTSGTAVTVSVIKSKENLVETLFSGINDVPSTTSTSENTTLIPVLPPVTPLVTPAQKKESMNQFVEGAQQSSGSPVPTPAQKKASITHFVEIENKLEEMFAGIVEEAHMEPPASSSEPLKNDSTLDLIEDDSFMKLEDLDAPAKEELTAEAEVKESPVSPKREIKKDYQEDKKPSAGVVNKKAKKSKSLPKRENSDPVGEVPSKKKRLSKVKSTVSPPKKVAPKSPGVVPIPKSPKKAQVPITPSKPLKSVVGSDIAKDIYAYDSGSNASSSKSRGPFVQIRGPRDSPLSISVVNAPLSGEDDGEKKSLKHKKFHDDSEYRHKVRSKGLHCSTLSTKYDAERKDASWICAFCKRGPHANELTGPSALSEIPPAGDLFGPYIITTQCPEFEKRLDDPYDRQFKSRKISKALDAASLAKPQKKSKKKSESSVDPTDIYLGITDMGNNSFEVWTHEDCMVWSPGVYLVGPKIAGLEEAVWTCSNMPCTACGLRGANVTCGRRGCLEAAHLCCARKAHWQLNKEDVKAYCPGHVR